MRFLKKKIAFAAALHTKKLEKQEQAVLILPPQYEDASTKPSSPISSPESKGEKKRKRIPGFSSTPAASRETKNIVKNYGKAICTFAVSYPALPYLAVILEEQHLPLEQFVKYINQIKDSIDGLHHFRSILLINEDDSSELVAKKKAFIAIGKVFIKYFSVNWIYNSRVFHKEAHLKFRFKMLRRIQNPELFTYLKNSKKKDANKNERKPSL